MPGKNVVDYTLIGLVCFLTFLVASPWIAIPLGMDHRLDLPDLPDLEGKVALVTGGSTGIGFGCAQSLAGRGARVLATSRNQFRASSAANIFAGEGMALDLSDFDDVRRFAAAVESKVSKLDYLVLNAGMMYYRGYAGPYTTDKGFDHAIATNYMGHWLLVHLLRPLIERSKTRVVLVSSVSHWMADREIVVPKGTLPKVAEEGEAVKMPESMIRYSASKMQAVLFAYRLQRELAPSGASAVVVLPGSVRTELGQVDRGKNESLMDMLPTAVDLVDGGAVVEAAALIETAPIGKMIMPYWTWEAAGSFLPKFAAGLLNHMIYESLLQSMTWGMRAFKSAPDSYDEALQDKLWEWTAKKVGVSSSSKKPQPTSASKTSGPDGGEL